MTTPSPATPVDARSPSKLLSLFVAALSAAAGLLATASLPASAQENFPNKQIRWIVPFPPGGIPDRLARTYAQHMGQSLGQSVIVENRPGANSLVGSKALAEQPADGHTLMMVTPVIAVGRALYPASTWPDHPLDVFSPVSAMIKLTNVVVVPADSPYKTMADLITAGKAGNEPIQYGVPSLGSSVHLGMEMLAQRAGAKMASIGFKGGPDLINNVLGGHVGVAADNLTNALSHIRSGRVRALMVMSPSRNAVIPDVPSAAEVGFPGFESVSWVGVTVKVNTPKPLVDKLSREIARISSLPEVRRVFEEQGDFIVSSTPEEFSSLIRNEEATMTKVIEKLGISYR